MQSWLGVGIVLAVGLAAVAYGYLWDRTTSRLRHKQLTSAPDRVIPGQPADAPSPTYLQAADLAARRPAPIDDPDALAALHARTDAAPSLPHGHLSPTFANYSDGLCVLDAPVILVVDGDVATVRELLPVLTHAKAARRPLAVVAATVADDVLQTLEANTLAGTLPAVATAVPRADQRCQLASLAGAVPVAPLDLKAGWVPIDHLGTCVTWVSSADRLWLVDEPPEPVDDQA